MKQEQDGVGLMKRLAREIEDLGSQYIPPKVFIYMNQFIKNPKTQEPVIAVQKEGDPALVYSNVVELLDSDGRVLARIKADMKGLKDAPVHHVKAWIETRLKVRVR